MLEKMEASLLSENKNLQHQNIFLTQQIKQMFRKEKKYKQMIKHYEYEVRELRVFNLRLEEQLSLLTKDTIG